MSKTKAFLKENSLVRSLANDEQHAFQTVYKSCFTIVTRSLQNMTADEMEAEDIYHAALLVLYEKAQSNDFELECKISTFLVAVARNMWLKRLEKEKRLHQKEKDYALLHQNEQANSLFDMQEIMLQQKQLNKLHKALDSLGSPCKDIIESFYIYEKSIKEIATHFNYTNANNAKTQKHKCLKRLKKIFLNQ